MDSTVGYDPTLPLDLDGSCNPDLLPEVTFRNHLELPDGSVPSVVKQNTGRMSPVRAITMKEYDQIISELRKENFSLKLRIYFLEERMNQKFGDGDDIFKTNIELRVEVESLKKELTDKQELLKKASLAMESITVNHQMDLQEAKGHLEKELQVQHNELADKYNQSILDSSVYQSDLKEAEEKVISLEDMLQKLQTELEQTKMTKLNGDEELNEVLQTLQIKDREINNLEDILKNCDEEAKVEREKCDLIERRMEEEIKQMKKHIDRKERDIQDAMEDQKETVKNLQGKVRDNQKTIAAKECKINELEDQLYQLDKDNKELTLKISQSEEENLEQEANTFKRDKTIQGFILAMNKKDKEITALKETFSESEDDVKRLKEELHQSNIDNNKKLLRSLGKKDGELVGFKEMLAKAENALKNSEEALNGLQDQLNKEKLDGQSRHDKLAQHYQLLIDDIQNQVQGKEKILHQLTQRLKDKDKQLHDSLNLLHADHSEGSGSSLVDLVRKLQQKLKEKEAAFESLEKEKLIELEEKEAELRSVKREIQEKDRDLSRANHILLTAEDNSESLQREVKEKEENVKQLTNCLQAAQKAFEEAMDNHVRAIEQKSNMIIRLKESIETKEASLQEAIEKSPGMSTDEVKKLRQQLRAKETTVQELLSEKNELCIENEKRSRDFFNKLQITDRDIKSLQQKHVKARSELEREIQQLQTDLSKRDLEIQRLEASGVWIENQLDKLRESLKEKDKTIEALFESGKEKDKLLQQAQQTRSPSISSSVTEMAHLQSLQDEIAFLLSHLSSKDAMINQLRRKSDPSKWQQEEIDRLSDEVLKKNQALKSSKQTENRLESELADLRKHLELQSQIQAESLQSKGDNSQLCNLIREQLAELKSLGDILRVERQIYITLNSKDGEQSSDSNTVVEEELNKIQTLRRQLQEGVEKNNTLRIILQQQATPLVTDEDKLNQEIHTTRIYSKNNLPDLDIENKFSQTPVEAQTEITASPNQVAQRQLDTSTTKLIDLESNCSLNLLSKSQLDSVSSSDLLNSENKYFLYAERPSEFSRLQNQCFSRISNGYGNTRELGCEHYYSSETTSESTSLNPQETVLSSNRIHQPVHSPPQLLRKIADNSHETVHNNNDLNDSLNSTPHLLRNPSSGVSNNDKVRNVSPRKVEFLSDSVFDSDNFHNSIYSPQHLLRSNMQSSTQNTCPQSLTNIESTKNSESRITADHHFPSLGDHVDLTVPDVDVDRLSADQSVLLSDDVSNMSAPSLRKLVTKLQNDLMDSLQENHNLQMRDSMCTRQIPGMNESDPTTADLQNMQQKVDEIQLVLSKTQHENETLHQHLQSPRQFGYTDNEVRKLKETLLKVEKDNNLLQKQIILNTQTNRSPSGFNPELILEMANEIEKLKKVVAENKSNLSDSDISENGINVGLSQDGTASPNRSRTKSVENVDVISTNSQGQGDIPYSASINGSSVSNSNVAKHVLNVGSHIPRLKRSGGTQPRNAPMIVKQNGENDLAVLQSLFEAAQAKVKNLEEKLSATENTVRFQSSKMKYYRALASDAGLIPKLASRSQSETNLFKMSKDVPVIITSSCENLTDFNENGSNSLTSDESKEYGKTESVTALKMQIDELINKLQRQTLDINILKRKSFDHTCRSLSPPNVSPRIKELKGQLQENSQSSTGIKFIQSGSPSPADEPQRIPEQDYIQNLKIRFPENERLRNSAERHYRRSPSPQKSLEKNISIKSRSQPGLDSTESRVSDQKLINCCRQLESELAEVKHDNTILASRILELGQTNKQHAMPAETLLKQVKDLENEKKKLEVNLQIANTRTEDFETEIRSYRYEKQKLEQNVRQCDQKIKWLEQDRTMAGSDQELLVIRQQLHESQNSCLQLRNQLEEISCFMSELINPDRGQSETSSSVGGIQLDKLRQHLQFSREIIDASLSDVSRVDERSRLDDTVTGSKYQSAIDEINKLQTQLNIQDTRNKEKLAQKDSEIGVFREEIVSLTRHGVPEGCDSETATPQRSFHSADGHPPSISSGQKSGCSTTSNGSRFISSRHIEEDFSVEQMRHRFPSGRANTRSASSITAVTDLDSDQESRLNIHKSFHNDAFGERGGDSKTTFIEQGDDHNITYRERSHNQNDISYRGNNLSALYLSKMNESDFLLSDSHFCNHSNGSMLGGRLGLDHVDSSETKSKVSDDTLSHVSSYKDGSVTPTGSEILTLKSRLDVVEDMNRTLKGEISVYENIVKSSGDHRSPLSHHRQGDLQDHLCEIRALRIRLEKSLDDCEKLRLQLEERLGEAYQVDHTNYENRIKQLDNLVADLKSQMNDRENVIREKITIIEEREKTIHKTKLILQENNQKMTQTEMKCFEMEKQRQQMEQNLQQREQHYHEYQQRREKQEIQLKKYQQRREKQESQLKKAGKEIRKLQQEILLWKEKAEEKIELNKTLKLELSMYEQLQASTKVDGQSNLDITDLLTEVHHLRIQLERCIDTNNRLRQTIEELLQQQLKHSKAENISPSSSTASDAADGRPSPQYSPHKTDHRATRERETYIHRKKREERYEFDFVGSTTDSRTRGERNYDNGFQSDRAHDTKYRIESSKQSSTCGYPKLAENFRFTTSVPHHCPNPNTSIRSLPSDLDHYFNKERSVKYWVDTAVYREVPHVDVDSDIRRLFAISKLDDFEKIRKENEEELSVLSGLEARVQDRINSVKRSTEQSVEYSTLKEIAMAIENLRICMDAEKLVIKNFWISQLPPVNELGEFYDAKLAEDNFLLRKELTKIKSDYDMVKYTAKDAEQRLHQTNRQRQGMEDAICQQLTRTNKILQQASDNFRTTKHTGPYSTNPLYLHDLTDN